MAINIYDFVKEEEYIGLCETLRDNETRIIYYDDNIDIAIKKVGRRVLTFVNTYGDKKLNQALNNVCSLV